MIRFSKFYWVYMLISASVLIPGIYSLIRYGFKPAIDFTGGSLIEVQLSDSTEPSVIDKAVDAAGIQLVSSQRSGASTYLLRMKPISDASLGQFEKTLLGVKGESAQVLRKETVGPILGKELFAKTVTASMFAVVVILGYVAYAFHSVKYGVSAVLALIHDVLVVFGSFSLLGHFFGVEVDTLFVTAFLTTMSLSVHDTIVIFDRIREHRKRDQHTDLSMLSDMALTETMNRSLVNSFTIFYMLLALVLMGGETVKWFAAALLIGSITGTYSSPFIAVPLVLLWDTLEKKTK